MTPLAAYMQAEKLTDAELARRVGRERSTITKVRLGAANPSLDLAVKIAALSEGAVPATSYPLLKRRRRRRAEGGGDDG